MEYEIPAHSIIISPKIKFIVKYGSEVKHVTSLWQQLDFNSTLSLLFTKTKILTEINGQLRVIVSLSVGNKVDLILSPLLLEALLRAPVLQNAAAYQDDDESPHQPEPWK